jgi:hypothetical protein
VKSLPMLAHAVRFDRKNPDLCPALVWKSQFTQADDSNDPSTSDEHYWCVYTQTCVGPDNGLVEPFRCSRKSRTCYRDAIRNRG